MRLVRPGRWTASCRRGALPERVVPLRLEAGGRGVGLSALPDDSVELDQIADLVGSIEGLPSDLSESRRSDHGRKRDR